MDMNLRVGALNTYIVKHFRDGKLIHEEEVKNLVVNQGLDDVLNKYFKGSAYTAAHYMGLKAAGAIAAGDTLASHVGWAESATYSGSRKSIVLGTVSGQSVNSVGNEATFTFTGSAAVAGAFVATVATGTAGILYAAVDFASVRNVLANDVLSVSATFTQASV